MTCVYDAARRLGENEGDSDPVEQWCGPGGLRLLSCEVDFRAGGTARLYLSTLGGGHHRVEGVRLEIVEPERVVFTGNLGLEGGSGTTGTVTFRRTESVV